MKKIWDKPSLVLSPSSSFPQHLWTTTSDTHYIPPHFDDETQPLCGDVGDANVWTKLWGGARPPLEDAAALRKLATEVIKRRDPEEREHTTRVLVRLWRDATHNSLRSVLKTCQSDREVYDALLWASPLEVYRGFYTDRFKEWTRQLKEGWEEDDVQVFPFQCNRAHSPLCVKLPPIAVYLPRHRHRELLVRNCYWDIFDRVFGGRACVHEIQGNPGIGKSRLLHLLAACRVFEHRPVAFFSSTKTGVPLHAVQWEPLAGGKEWTRAVHLMDAIKQEDNLVLVDGCMPVLREAANLIKCPVVVTVDPQVVFAYNPFWGCDREIPPFVPHMTYRIPLWNLFEELLPLLRQRIVWNLRGLEFEAQTEEEAVQRFHRPGGSIQHQLMSTLQYKHNERNVAVWPHRLRCFEDWQALLHPPFVPETFHYFHIADLEQTAWGSPSSQATTAEGGDTIPHLAFNTMDRALALFHRAYFSHSDHRAVQWLHEALKETTDMAATRGWLHAHAFGHMSMATMKGKLHCRCLRNSSEAEILIQPMTLVLYLSLESLIDDGKDRLYVPIRGTLPSVDAFSYPTLRFFQFAPEASSALICLRTLQFLEPVLMRSKVISKKDYSIPHPEETRPPSSYKVDYIDPTKWTDKEKTTVDANVVLESTRRRRLPFIIVLPKLQFSSCCSVPLRPPEGSTPAWVSSELEVYAARCTMDRFGETEVEQWLGLLGAVVKLQPHHNIVPGRFWPLRQRTDKENRLGAAFWKVFR